MRRSRLRTLRPAALAGLAALLLAVPASPGAADTIVYRVNCGGPTIAPLDAGPAWDHDGLIPNQSPYVNAADNGDQTFTTSAPLVAPHSSVPVYVPLAVYDDERWDLPGGADMLWEFPVTNGFYRVNLMLAEAYSGLQSPGARVMDIEVEGATAIAGLDAYVRYGGYRPGMETLTAFVNDGSLSIAFRHVADNPCIRAIEVVSISAAGYLGVTPSNLAFGPRLVGTVSAPRPVTVTNLGGPGDPAIEIQSVTAPAGWLHNLSAQTLAPGESRTFEVRFAPDAPGVANGVLSVLHDGAASPATLALAGEGVTQFPVAFGKSVLAGGTRANPTSIQFGPDGRLYLAQKDGRIYALTIARDAANQYRVTESEEIALIRDIVNHDDGGQVNPAITDRLVTGICVTGTPQDPVLWVTNSDPRMNVAGDIGLDTNSGTISKLTRTNGVWSRHDVVRGLPRSENDHSTNGIALDTLTNTLYVAQGGNCNMGAPSLNFSFLPEYALSAAILSVDLDAIGDSTYDLPTLDDEDRPGVVDANDPFGGNDGKNQAKLVPGGPVQVHSSGYRNPFDVLLHSNGHLYTIDNGPNAGWGGPPIGVGPGGNCTNADNDNDSFTYADNLHMIPGAGYFAGHPNPTRASTTNTFNPTNPQSPVTVSNPVECEYRVPGFDGSLAQWFASTNGLAEYRASDFGGELQGSILAASFNNTVQRIRLNAAGDSARVVETLFSNIDVTPLDLTALGDDSPLHGTIWVADYVTGQVWVFEPTDFDGGGFYCAGTDSPLLDEDGDGYSNADEIANGTSPCSPADRPADFDHDLLSDRRDPDDDNDGRLDVEDPFARDANDGATTALPIQYTWDAGNPGTGLFGLGFTGLMANGSTDYLDQYVESNLTPGGAAGKLTIDAVPAGDAAGPANDLDYGFQFGFACDSSTTPFTARTRVSLPFFGGAPADSQSEGLFVGTGMQDDFVAVALGVRGGQPVIVVTQDVAGVATETSTPAPGVLSALGVDLHLDVDPGTGTIQPRWQPEGGALTAAGPPLVLGAGSALRASLRTSAPVGVGLIATSRGAAPFTATWDYLYVVGGGTTGVGDGPRNYVTRLLPAAPHPVRGGTTLRFEVARASRVRLVLHGVDGRRVRTLADGMVPAGPGAIAWNARDTAGRRVAPGVYFARLEADGRVETQRLVVIE